MPRRPQYGRRYLRERKRLLAGKPPCCEHGCIYPATTADHIPPLSRHIHRDGSGCCILRPMCREHMLVQAGQLGFHGKRKMSPPDLRREVELDPDGFDVDHPVWDRARWLDGLREVPVDGWWPRLMTMPHPDAVGSLGDEVTAWARAEYGIESVLVAAVGRMPACSSTTTTGIWCGRGRCCRCRGSRASRRMCRCCVIGGCIRPAGSVSVRW